MKKILLSFAIFAISSIIAFAQQKVVIKLIDGTTIEKEVWEVQNISFESSANITSPATADVVDLGLSVKWANFNFGATAPEENGYYIGWGDLTGKNYSSNLAYFPTTTPTFNITNGEYDIIHQLWGSDWRYPSADEMKELIDNCTWTYDASRHGYSIVSNKNSNSIFLPLAGQRNGKDTLKIGMNGYYWTGSLASDNKNALGLVLDNLSYNSSDILRYIGCNIRPVFGKYLYGAVVSSATTSNITPSGASIDVVFGGDIAHSSLFGISYSTESTVNPDNGTTMTSSSVDSEGKYSYAITSLQPNTTYYYVAFVTYNGNRITGEVKSFTTATKFPVAEAVDLGLSVKWASWNMGANQESDCGNYIAWGDPTGENSSFNNADYPNNGDITATNFDIAKVQWGDKWRMPTDAELQELGTLTKEIVTRNGTSGFLVTGTNGNQIFIPCGGYKYSGGISDYNAKAYYWSSSIYNLDKANSCTFGIVSNQIVYDEKKLHMLIRPVYDPKQVVKKDTTDVGKTASSVDLGLSVKWATYNIGATASTETGNYYAWGETSSKTDYSIQTYKYYSTTTNSYINIGSDIESSEYDVASTLWGGTWRMPTNEEYAELVKNCIWVWSAANRGYTVTSKNGNSIFLPAGGQMVGTELTSNENQGHYWTSNINDMSVHADDHWSYKLVFTSSDHFANGGDYRYKGLLIRPVRP
jgi:hypothetical protein